MKKPSRRQQVIMEDLGNHVTERMQSALMDAIQLLDSQDAAYTLTVSVIGAIVCWSAKLRPGEEQVHAERIKLVLLDLCEVMKMHRKHG